MEKKIGVVVLFLLVIMLIGVVNAVKLDIDVANNYAPGDEVYFKIFIYDDNNEVLDGEVNYVIENYYAEIVDQGVINSGGDKSFVIPLDAIKGPWRITAKYNDIEINRLFNVGELEKVEIKLEGDSLVIKNIGNVPFDKKILIYIGEQDQTASIYLEVGETKKMKLTAPVGTYDVKVIGDVIDEEGNKDDIVYSGVPLTGNVIGLETVMDGSFWRLYPMVSLFLVAIIGLAVFMFGMRFFKNPSNIKNKVANKNIIKK